MRVSAWLSRRGGSLGEGGREVGEGGGFVLGMVEGGELCVERGVVGVFGERSGEQGFGFGRFLLLEQEMDEGSGGLGVVGGGGEKAAKGLLGCGGVAGGLGKLAGE